MKSLIAEAIGLKYDPIAIVLTDTKPETAIQFKEGKFGCVMSMLAAAARGRHAVFDRSTYGCVGGGTGLGFGNMYCIFPGSIDCFYRFLSTGNHKWQPGRRVTESTKSLIRDETYDNLMHGEAYIKSPELVKKFLECLPMTNIPFTYVVFKPLHTIDENSELPVTVVFLVDADQLSALVVLANYARGNNENVIIPFAAGCHSIGIYPYAEAKREKPRAVIGLVDISARVQVKRQLHDDVMTFAAPFSLFREMEDNIPGSFLQRKSWKELMDLKYER